MQHLNGLRTAFLLLLGCFFLSGFAGLIYQSAWTQEFALVFGTSEFALVTVLTAYMAGLASGAAITARWGRTIRRPVLVYALLELGIAVTALAVPYAIQVASILQVVFFGDVDLANNHGPGLFLFDLVASFLILMVPTGLMGATLPLLAQHAVSRDEEIGSRIGMLYTWNTLGAAAGALVAAYVLLPHFGLGLTVWMAVAANFAVFCVALLLTKSAPKVPDPKPLAPSKVYGGPRLILVLMAFSGALSFTLEIVWTRLLSQLLGGTIYAFGIMLSTFLLGIALGAALASRLAARKSQAWKWYASSQFGVALFTLAAFLWADSLPELASRLGNGFGSLLGAGSFLCLITLLPAAICSGATFPFAVRIYAQNASDSRRASGQVFAWNTFGAIVGAMLAGFWILPQWAYQGTITGVIVCSCGLGSLALMGQGSREAPPQKGSRKVAFAALVTTLLMGFALWLMPLPTPWKLLRASSMNRKSVETDIAYFAVGKSANVMVVENGADWRLTTNGLPESVIQAPGSQVAGLATARWLSMLPLAARPDLESMLVIGFGAGVTVERIPASVKSIQVVELEPEVIRANQAMAAHRKFDALADPRLSVHINDARSALLLAQKQFDAIISQPSHPWTSGASHLFTREFFHLVNKRLSSDGVFVQWIGLQFVDLDLLKTLIATLRDVFPHVEVYCPGNRLSILFLASNEPLISQPTLVKTLANASEAWGDIHVNRPEDILVARILTNDGSRRVSESSPISTDYHNLLKIHSPKVLLKGVTAKDLNELLAEHDALLGDLGDDQRLYLVHRLLVRNHLSRARNVVFHMKDPIKRDMAKGLLALKDGSKSIGIPLLVQALKREPGNAIAEQALLYHAVRQGHQQASGPYQEVPWSPLALAVIQGSQALAEMNWDRLQELDSELVVADVGNPLLLIANRLRIQWRLASGEERVVAETEALLNQLERASVQLNTLFLALKTRLYLQQEHRARGTLNTLLKAIQKNRSQPTRETYSRRMMRLRNIFRDLPPKAKAWAAETFPQQFTDFSIPESQ